MIKGEKSGVAWLGLGLYVAAYDYWAIKHNKETLSAAFGRSMAHPVGRWATICIVTLLLKHLLFPNFFSQIDPLKYVAERWRQGVETAVDCQILDG